MSRESERMPPRVSGHAILRYALRVEGYRYDDIRQVSRAQQQRYEREILLVAMQGRVLNTAQALVFVRSRVSKSAEISRQLLVGTAANNGGYQPWGEYRMLDNMITVLERDADGPFVRTFMVADDAQMQTLEAIEKSASQGVTVDASWGSVCDLELLLVDDDGHTGLTSGKDELLVWLARAPNKNRLRVFAGWDGLHSTARILLKGYPVPVGEVPWPWPEREASRFDEAALGAWVTGVLDYAELRQGRTFVLCRPRQASLLVSRLYGSRPIPDSFLEAPAQTGYVHGFVIQDGEITKHVEVRHRP